MNHNFYTNVVKYGNNILYRGIEDGRRVNKKILYSPVLFLPSNKKTHFTNLLGEYLAPKQFDTIKEASEFVKSYEGIENFKIYGNQNYSYAYITDNFKDHIEWSQENIIIDIIDIETDNSIDVINTPKQITAITLNRIGKKSITFGYGNYEPKEGEMYVKCKDEYTLLKRFLGYWEKCEYPDIITGWNSLYFDIPYLYNRMIKILGEKEANKLSPWKVVSLKEKYDKLTGKKISYYNIFGIAQLDYQDLYKNFAPDGKSQESYKLDHIAYMELGENKLSYDEYDSLSDLYRQNYQKFCEYNIKDCKLIEKFEDKLKLLELALTLSYDMKCNYDDVFTQTRMWDSMIYNYLFKKNIIVPAKEIKEKEPFKGGYVKPVQTGRHNFIATYDLNSLYSHLIMQYNISPETIIDQSEYTPEMRRIVSDDVSVDRLLEQGVDLTNLSGACITPNGQFFKTQKQGFLPEILQNMYDDRKKYKKMMLEAEQEYENVLKELEKRGL